MSRCIIGATWGDAPHLSDSAKADLAGSYQKYQVDARTKGIPQLGSGAVYPFPESDIVISNFDLPATWPRAFGLDTARSGVTAAVWAALDTENDLAYLYSDYRRSQAETAVHAKAILSRGPWIPGVGDASAILDEDRVQYIEKYKESGIDLELADKAVETGVQSVYDMFSEGRLKIFASCRALIEELRQYRRDEKGRIVKQRDHCMDAMRYLVFTGLKRAKRQPSRESRHEETYRIATTTNRGATQRKPRWMSR